MDKRILLLGSTGKVGTALNTVLGDNYTISCKNSKDFDAINFEDVREMVRKESPDIVINTVAFLGIDPCELEPEKAFKLNALYPRVLAQLSSEMGFLLVHFSTDAVFNSDKEDFYYEEDTPVPLNVYGFTKYGGDCLIQSETTNFYLFRLSVQFGESVKETQFVEKMLSKIKGGEKKLRISDDIVSSPTYSLDVARNVKEIIEGLYPNGLYHIANDGKATLYDLMKEVSKIMCLDVEIEKASYKDFAYIGKKNINTPIRSSKLPPLRHWKEAVREFCEGGLK